MIITKINALLTDILPLGISLISEDQSFALSMFLSIYRLNPIAAERANIIKSPTSIKVFHSNPTDFTTRKKPINAKGIAKIIRLNFIKERCFFIIIASKLIILSIIFYDICKPLL